MQGQWDERALTHYHEVLSRLNALGLSVCLTLNHFTVPAWLARQGGWQCPRAVNYFTRYAAKVAHEYSSCVDLWLTLNEPVIYAAQAYLYGAWPPQHKSVSQTLSVVRTLARAHVAAYKVIRAASQAPIGSAHNVMSLQPFHRANPLDRLACRAAAWFWNSQWLSRTLQTHDFIGLNYYFHQRVKFSPDPGRLFHNFAAPVESGAEASAMDWEVWPEGLYEALQWLTRYHKPVYITENGIAPRSEAQRESFIRRSLAQVERARQAGLPIKGYFYWSLLDNFEWDKGFRPRFGLVAVDYHSQARSVREAAKVYTDWCEQWSKKDGPILP